MYLLVGAGQMGRNYFNNLLQLGIDPRELLICDAFKTPFVEEISTKYPDTKVFVGEYVQLGELALQIKAAFVLVNTPAHLSVIEELARQGIRNFFVEKPLVFDLSELEKVDDLRKSGCVFYTAFLINFSPIVEFVKELMHQEDLVMLEGRSVWGKNRTGNSRPTAGDLEDEACHALQILLRMAQINQTVLSLRGFSKLSHHDFVDKEVQQKAQSKDPSFPSRPNSSTAITAMIETLGSNHDVLVNSYSSYILAQQERTISLVLGKKDGGNPVYSIRMDFDVAGQDRLVVTTLVGNSFKEFVYDGRDKIKDEINAFLFAIDSGEFDRRLTGFTEGAMMVRVSDWAMHSSESGSIQSL